MENLEVLKDIVKPETYALIEAETKDSTIKLCDLSKGEFVSKSKYGALEAQLNSTTELLNNKSKDYDTLKGQTGDNEALKNQIDALKSTFETEKNDLKTNYEKQLKKSTVTAKIIADYKPKDVNDVLGHIDLDKVIVDGDSITGLKEQIDPLKETKAYYFNETKPGKTGFEHGDNDTDNTTAMRAAFGLPNKD